MVHLKSVKELDEYIAILQDFRKRFDKQLQEITPSKKVKK
jgi:hypothetical protein